MNDQQHVFWNRYVRECADLLGLKDHHPSVEREPPKDDGSVACIWTLPDVVHSRVYLSSHFLTVSSPDEQRATIAHELLHIHLAIIDAHVRFGVRNLEKDSLVEALPELIEQDIEMVIDRLSYVVAPLLPLPVAS